MLGPSVNALTIVVCSLAGCFLLQNIPERFGETLKKGLGLATIYIGIQGALTNQRPLLLIMSLVAGAIIGELIDIDRWMNRLGQWAEQKLYRPPPGGEEVKIAGKPEKPFAQGFVTASILFCTGSMAIVGSMQSGLLGDHKLLYTKSILDGTFSIVFGKSMGMGVLFSAIPVFLYQGSIVLLSMALKDFLTAEIITEMSAVGNLLVAAIGLNFVCLSEGKPIKVANFIPAIFIPWMYMALETLAKLN
ncbi:MAG: DUF554 domain-containing protein [Treponema sp.]|nr:DUF554 domain-containing protein [Treponema sp.]